MKALPLLLLSALLLAAGCEENKTVRAWNDASGASSSGAEKPAIRSDLVGTWRLVNGDSAWYIHFADDGTWRITDDREGESLRVHGTYTVDSGKFSGPMTNPGVGTGMISGTFSGGAIVLDFVEYWHSPYKHVPYTGSRI